MSKITKKRKKELRKLYEEIQSKKYMEGVENSPMCSSYELVGYMLRNKKV
jgi:hypothetical protein